MIAKGWLIASALIAFCHPSHAANFICFVETTPQTWIEKTGEHVAVTMDMAIGSDVTTPAMLTIGDDGKWTFLFKGPDGQTCVMAVGSNAVVAPATVNQ